jgi:hypothetical protein
METISLGLRLPAPLRDKLSLRAELSNRSMNGEIVNRLEASFRSDTRVADDLFDCLDLPRIVRMKASSTSGDVTRILNVARHLVIQRTIFAAKANALNNAVLVLILESPRVTFVLDGSWINMAREHREKEVQAVFQGFDRLGLLDSADYCAQLVPETSGLPPDEALSAIAKAGHIKPLKNLADYLRVLAQHEYFDPANYRASAELADAGVARSAEV